jgi:5-methyltetrahydrofolate--homocysteine methyltransferase
MSENQSDVRAKRSAELISASKERILVLDGGTGTALQSMTITAADFGGAAFEGCNENLVLTRPDIVAKVHDIYLEAGCDIVETNTFGATPVVLDEYKLGSKTYEINKRAAEIAREVCSRYDRAGRTHFVAGSIGPTTKSLSLTGGITFESLIDNYYEQCRGLFDGGADYLLIETCNDTRNVKAALLGIDRLFEERSETLPVAVSATIESTGTMLGGQSVEALLAALMHRDLLYLGLNCATGPEFMTDHIRSLAKLSPFPVACVPNAGLPDEDGKYLETPEMLTNTIKHFAEKGWVGFVGGCCGTHAGHIKALSTAIKTLRPHLPTTERKSFLSGIDHLEITDELRPVIVGERTNVIGSRKFKDLIKARKFDEASEVARAQVKAGAHIIDVCLADPEADEVADIEKFLDQVVKKIRVPLMIDSTDAKVIARALTYCQGKAVINSINLEDGEERFEEVVPLAKKFGAALVVGTIDEDPVQGMAVTRERKLAVAERSHKLLTEKYGIPEEDIYFDPLVFPCGTGDEAYRTSAPETIEGIRLIKQRFPRCKTVLGISNVSFGLPGAGREVLNSVFLYQCTLAGLDLAIVNSEKLERYGSIDPEEIAISEELLRTGSQEALVKFTEKFRARKSKQEKDRSSLTLDERLAAYVVEGSKDGLLADLDIALKERDPLAIINGPLMKGMDEVGRLFNANKLIVAEVLQSAEVMKASVSHLEPHMEKAESTSRGKVLLATVKGDVHDIGKNLVDIILSNNGFEVVNLGIKVPPEQLIAAVKQHNPDIIGLSGLLVKSAHQMVTTAEDLARAGIKLPVLVGGAALSRGFTEKRILPAYAGGSVFYAQDAMNGLDLTSRIRDPDQKKSLQDEIDAIRARVAKDVAAAATDEVAVAAPLRTKTLRTLESVPLPPDFDRHAQRQIPIEQIWKYINPLMLYTRHLGVRARAAKQFDAMTRDPVLFRKLKQDEPTAVDIWEKVEEVKAQYAGSKILQARGVYRFYPAAGDGSKVVIFEDASRKKIVSSFDFLRQTKGEGLCLSDYLNPVGGAPDSFAMFVTTVGENVREESAKLKAQGEFLKSHILQALAIESAEAYAEYMHTFIRAAWGFPDDPNTTMLDRFQAKYRGKRYSFGYPACPRIEDQTLLFEMLAPQDIGVQLTEGYMMDPEASVSAIVFHHPDAKYFGVNGGSGTGAEIEDSDD